MVGKMRKFALILVTTLQLLHQAESFKVVSYTQDEKVIIGKSLFEPSHNLVTLLCNEPKPKKKLMFNK